MSLGIVTGIFISRNWAKRALKPQRPGQATLGIPTLRIEQRPPQEGGARIVALDIFKGTW